MSKALHIVDGLAPRDCLRTLGMLAREGDAIVSVGPAPELGEHRLDVTAVHAPLGSPRLCGRRIAAMASGAEVLHAWSPAAMKAARTAGRLAGLPVIYSLHCLPRARDLPKIIEPLSAGLIRLTVPTEAARQALMLAGAPGRAVHVLPPPAAGIPKRDELRSRTREALGICESDFLLVAPGKMTRDAGHMYASWAHAIVRHVREGVKLLLPGRGETLRSVRFFSARTGFRDDVRLTEDRFSLEESLAAADAAVFLQKRDSGVAALAAAMAAGLPIACSQTPDAAECTENGKAAVLVDRAEPRAAAAALLKLIEDAALAGRCARAAKEIAAARFAADVCRGRLNEVYAAAAAACPA